MFIHLRLHTEFSVVDGTNRVDEVVDAAAADAQGALAITDLNNQFATVKFYRACRSKGVKPIVGAEIILEGMGADPTPSYNAASFMRSPSTAATIMVIAIVLAFPVRQAFERRVVANLHGPWRGVALALAFAYASLLIFLFIVAISLVAANTYNPFLYFRF